ncbi:regulator of G-protein signaling 22-like [Mobula hypostoma]|uniref:regulator of G-protein signaling 22-like n=1 Tax=Mobula hypostoma TaxID=723540 RepID=UPI002FC38172
MHMDDGKNHAGLKEGEEGREFGLHRMLILEDRQDEDFLLTDDLLVDYFNVFLALLNFPMPIWFNKATGTFEIVDNAKEKLRKHLKSLVQALLPVDPIYNVTIKSKRKYSQPKQNETNLDVKFDDTYVVMCLDHEQGMAWIKSERLPAFIRSDCYFEYRIAKLLSQLDCSSRFGMPHIDSTYRPWATEVEEKSLAEDLSVDLIPVHQEASSNLSEVLVTGEEEEFPMHSTKFDSKIIAGTQHPTGDTVRPVERGTTDISILDEVMHSLQRQKILDKSGKTKVKLEQESCTSSFTKPRIVDDTLFEFIPEYALDISEIVSFEHKSESEIKPMQDIIAKNKEKVDAHFNITDHKEQIRTGETTTKENLSAADETTQGTETNLSPVIHEAKQHSDGNTQIAPMPNVSQTEQMNVEQSPALSNIKSHGLTEGTGAESTESDSSSEENDIKSFCYVTPHHNYNFKSRRDIEKFKSFLQGTAGEKYWWLWMDIERLNITKDGKRKQSYLNKIRSRYLFSGGEYCMSAEIRERLALSIISQWTVDNLCKIQADIVAPLLLYWGPRYCINQGSPIRQAGVVLKDWQDRQLRPKPDVGPFSVTPLDQIKIICISKEKCPPKDHKLHQFQRKAPVKGQLPKTCGTQNTADTPPGHREGKEHVNTSKCDISMKISESMKAFNELALRKAKEIHNLKTSMHITKYHDPLCDYKINDLLHALHNESRTGYFFTNFCKETGNELWCNSVDLWFELKEYQRLFYAEIFQPFKLKRQAQFIFATYTVEGAPADVKLDIENQKSIYNKLEPPFEELFDHLEEHILILLLVPWVKMLEMDTSKYQKVDIIRETRHLDSKYFKKLRALQRRHFPHKDFPSPVRSASHMESPEDLKSSSIWQMVPEEFRDYTFEGLVRNRLLLENFQEYLRENLAGMDLNCWLDIEKYRKIPKDEKENKANKSKEIIKKYLNYKYFFGPSSPATKSQQEEVVMLAGGQYKLLHDQLSLLVGTELQNYAKARLERKWLPKFLASPEFLEKSHKQIQMEDVVEDQMLIKSKKKRELMKRMTNRWTISSKEIIAFRKALLNPVTALQFQKFVSTKGELMENNVVFWLEVQKYKDLCHSHASEEMIQNKISVIINCFINSSIPPAVQIDIPLEYAQKIISQRHEQGPYIFREAQMAVFNVLFQLWPAFSEFRKRLDLDAILPVMERKEMSERDKQKGLPMDESSAEKMESGRDVSSADIGHPRYLGISSRSSGSRHSVKAGSGKFKRDHRIIKSESEIESQQVESHGQKLSWSLSKYVEALDREKALILRQATMEQGTIAGSSKYHMAPNNLSESSKYSKLFYYNNFQPPAPSGRVDSQTLDLRLPQLTRRNSHT